MRYDERYDRGFRGSPGRGRRAWSYGDDYRRGYGEGLAPPFGGAAFPIGPGYMPMTWGWYGPFGTGLEPGPYGPGDAFRGVPPKRPRESPAYGQGGDRELRRWARDHGYDIEYTVYPRDNRRHR